MLIERHKTVVGTDYHQFVIEAGPPRQWIIGRHPEFPLAVFAEDSIFVRVGLRVGPVNVSVEVHDTPPTYDDTDWEDCVEGDLVHNTDQGAKVVSFWSDGQTDEDGQARSLFGITPPGNRRYRVRIYARGKDIHYDGPLLDGPPVEDYRIQMWPTSTPMPADQLKHASGR